MTNKLILSSLLLTLTTSILTASVTVKQNRDLNFGQMYPGQTSSKTIPGTCALADADATIGKMQFDHSPSDKNTTVTVDWTTPATLDDGSGNSIVFTNSEAWCTDSTSGTPEDITDWGSGTYDGQGTSNNYHNIYWGGSIDTTGAVPGTYSGTISVTLSY